MRGQPLNLGCLSGKKGSLSRLKAQTENDAQKVLYLIHTRFQPGDQRSLSDSQNRFNGMLPILENLKPVPYH